MIKIEFPADRTDIASAIGRALLEVGGAQQAPAGTAAASQEQSDDFKKGVETVTAAKCGDEQGPFYWVHHESEACGICDTMDEIEEMQSSEPLVECVGVETYEKLAKEWAEAAAKPRPGDAGPQQDTNGVPFDPNYCSKSDQPFYTSGKQLGCWKKRRGLDQAEYDAWYASQLQPAAPVVEEEQAPVDVAAALTGQSSSLFPDGKPADGPKTAGELMVWVSEQQVAGHITQEDVQAAYQAAGCQNTGMLFADEAAYVGPIHAHLADKVSA